MKNLLGVFNVLKSLGNNANNAVETGIYTGYSRNNDVSNVPSYGGDQAALILVCFAGANLYQLIQFIGVSDVYNNHRVYVRMRNPGGSFWSSWKEL